VCVCVCVFVNFKQSRLLKGRNLLLHRHFKGYKYGTRNERQIQGAAEIVKHLKILIICFPGRVSLHTGVRTEAVSFKVSRQGVLGS
jgi:hypothetical protein